MENSLTNTEKRAIVPSTAQHSTAQHSTAQHSTAQLIYCTGIDLCYEHSQLIDVANAIAARYDAGICKHKYEHSGVLEIWKIT